jgi:hypothetical protein
MHSEGHMWWSFGSSRLFRFLRYRRSFEQSGQLSGQVGQTGERMGHQIGSQIGRKNLGGEFNSLVQNVQGDGELLDDSVLGGGGSVIGSLPGSCTRNANAIATPQIQYKEAVTQRESGSIQENINRDSSHTHININSQAIDGKITGSNNIMNNANTNNTHTNSQTGTPTISNVPAATTPGLALPPASTVGGTPGIGGNITGTNITATSSLAVNAATAGDGEIFPPLPNFVGGAPGTASLGAPGKGPAFGQMQTPGDHDYILEVE